MKRRVSLALLFASVLISCASFSYVHYGLDVNRINTDGARLMGPSEEFDRPLSECKSENDAVIPCIVFKYPEYFKMRRDYIEMKHRLEACEKARDASR